ncbi:proline-rich protein 36-like [Oryctolagus cuniculus]|uniref:proline-rich protein 36-like n=1 Tax=Oryctolagus cuniculus TaxID=9986 RepID=UPI0038799753
MGPRRPHPGLSHRPGPILAVSSSSRFSPPARRRDTQRLRPADLQTAGSGRGGGCRRALGTATPPLPAPCRPLPAALAPHLRPGPQRPRPSAEPPRPLRCSPFSRSVPGRGDFLWLLPALLLSPPAPQPPLHPYSWGPLYKQKAAGPAALFSSPAAAALAAGALTCSALPGPDASPPSAGQRGAGSQTRVTTAPEAASLCSSGSRDGRASPPRSPPLATPCRTAGGPQDPPSAPTAAPSVPRCSVPRRHAPPCHSSPASPI